MVEQNITLNTGTKMPIIGLGTWKSEPTKVGQAVEYALLEADYKHVDCAAIYRNEQEIGQAFNQVFTAERIKREDIFITSKLWNTNHAKANVEKACRQTLKDLQLDYLDLYLMHWGLAIASDDEQTGRNMRGEPLDKNGFLITVPISVRETWEAMEVLVQKGLVKNIGVANFTAPMLVDLLSYAKILPAVNQIELHPYNAQTNLVEFCQYKNIIVTAYSPLGRPGVIKEIGTELLLIEDPNILAIAKTHGKSPAQVLIRWAMQRNTIVIPKSTNPENIKANINVFDFELSEQEMASISKLDRKHRYVNPSDWWKIPYFD